MGQGKGVRIYGGCGIGNLNRIDRKQFGQRHPFREEPSRWR